MHYFRSMRVVVGVLVLVPGMLCAAPATPFGEALLWLDAGDLTISGEGVSQWRDQSGQGHDAVQAKADRQPTLVPDALGGQPVLRFDGNDYLTVPLKHDWTATDWTVFAVASMDADAQNNYRGIVGNRFGEGRSNWWTLGTHNDGTTYLEFSGGGGLRTKLHPANDRACIYAIVKQGEQFTLYRNGKLIGKHSRPEVGGLSNELRIGMWYGDGQQWDGDIAEVAICEGAFSEDKRLQTEARLADKWGIFFLHKIYQKKPTWAATLLETRQALHAYLDRPQHPHTPATLVEELWQQIKVDFPTASRRMERDAAAAGYTAADWLREEHSAAFETALIGLTGNCHLSELTALRDQMTPADDPRWLALYQEASKTRDPFIALQERLAHVNPAALQRAVDDLRKTFPEMYRLADSKLRQITTLAQLLPDIEAGLAQCDAKAAEAARTLLALQREALLANPLLDFEELLLVQRSVNSPRLGLVQNWQSNCMLPRKGFNDRIAALPLNDLEGPIQEVYKPEDPVFVGDVDLHFDAERMLFSSIGTNNCWQIFEIGTDGTGLRQVTPGDDDDVDNYDACYLPDGRIIFGSTAYFAAVPCVNGSTRTSNLYRMNADGSDIHQLCFDQEHNWCPTVLPNGRVLYLRWEYTDTPHSHDRVLFHMNPDGTAQREFYGSNSYWPNSAFYARPIPGHATQFAAIVGGHHGVPRMGELVLFDAARGRREAEGAIQRIPGYGIKVESETDARYASTLIQDNLVDNSWPKFLHPYPLNDSYFLVSCKPSPTSLWGIYLVDVFDNMLLLREEPGYALFEPLPLRKTVTPPIIPDVTDRSRQDATVYLADVYTGGGLRGVPRGEVKALRLFSYHFLYPGMGGPQAVVGMEGPWDMRRTLGTVPVEPDGSAFFRVPAKIPISIQPLDKDGKALQLMRSWFTGMPGEVLSCVGCHESQSSSAPVQRTLAARRKPSKIEPWYGPSRGYNFERELQPVLDTYCIGCHDGSERADGKKIPDLKERAHITDYDSVFHHGGKDAGHFSVSYVNLHRYVRRPGLESDYHMLDPLEYHVNTTQLYQMLKKGHHNVQLDDEAWDRLITWIDLNAPFHGTWTEIAGAERVAPLAKRRRELLQRYANMDLDPEAVIATPAPKFEPVLPKSTPATNAAPVALAAWPMDADEAARQQAALGNTRRSIDLGDGLTLDLVLIPAGSFVMGDANGLPDESPAAAVRIEEPFWMGVVEVSNAQFERFDPTHDSGVESRFSMQFGVRGFYMNAPDQPVVRVHWQQAMAFCDWLRESTGEAFTLPTEAQWEYACRAGTATEFFYGDQDTDFAAYANLADLTLREFVCHTYKKEREPWLHASKYDDWIPKDMRFDDGGFLADGLGKYRPNAWGLHDMHGNVWEWTKSRYQSYPYDANDGRNDPLADGDRVVRGGSWRDRPQRARSAFRLPYRSYQGVYNVGFRVVCPADRITLATAKP